VEKVEHLFVKIPDLECWQKRPDLINSFFGYLLGSTHADDVAMCTLGRVSVARMAAVKPYGWVHASLERVRVVTSFSKWRELDNQNSFFTYFWI